MISNAQKALLHIAEADLRKRTGFTHEMYVEVLRELGGVESSVHLTNKGFDAVMKRFEELGFKNTSPGRRRRWSNPQPAALITREQQELIATLYEQLGWSETARQMGFSKRCCKKSFPQTRADANRVIEGLKAMIARLARSESSTAIGQGG